MCDAIGEKSYSNRIDTTRCRSCGASLFNVVGKESVPHFCPWCGAEIAGRKQDSLVSMNVMLNGKYIRIPL